MKLQTVNYSCHLERCTEVREIKISAGNLQRTYPTRLRQDIPRSEQAGSSVVKGNFVELPAKRSNYRIGELNILCFNEAWSAQLTRIIRRLSQNMSKVLAWMVCFDLPMPHEGFDILDKEILGLTRFGI